jgi:hypothetical protein
LECRITLLFLFQLCHILIRKAKMVADFVEEDVADNGIEGLAAFAPVVEDRAAVEVNTVGQAPDIGDAALGQGNALIKAQQIVRRIQIHHLGYVIIREILNDDQDVAGLRAQWLPADSLSALRPKPLKILKVRNREKGAGTGLGADFGGDMRRSSRFC